MRLSLQNFAQETSAALSQQVHVSQNEDFSLLLKLLLAVWSEYCSVDRYVERINKPIYIARVCT